MTLLKTVLASSVATVALGTAVMAETWDMPVAYPANNYHTENAQMFVDAVKACSGGELDITIHAGGSLFKGDEIKQALLQGGSPATPDDLRKRFDTFMNERCKGKDATKLRFVIE